MVRRAAQVFGSLFLMGIYWSLAAPIWADAPPAADALRKMLRDEPINQANWKAWRARLRDWSGEHLDAALPAFKEGFVFAKGQLDAKGNLAKAVNNKADAPVLWLLLGGDVLLDPGTGKSPVAKGRDAEKYLRNAVKADNKLARARYWLAIALMQQELTPVKDGGPAKPNVKKLQDALKEFEEARILDVRIKGLPALAMAELAIKAENSDVAEFYLQEALKEHPNDLPTAQLFARSVAHRDYRHKDPFAPVIKPLVDTFPSDGTLRTWHAVALAHDNRLDDAVRELDEARKLKFDPSSISPDAARKIDDYRAHNLEAFYSKKNKENPSDRGIALDYAQTIANRGGGEHAQLIRPLIEKFPDDGLLQARYAVALARDERWSEAEAALKKARALQFEATKVGSSDSIKKIAEIDNRRKQREEEARKKAAEARQREESEAASRRLYEGPLEFFKTVGWWALWFSIVYGTIMLLMCVGGLVLAKKTTGTHAMNLLDAPPDRLVEPGGQVVLAKHETSLKRFYLASLLTALVLFYVALPFIFLGLLIIFVITFVLVLFSARGRHGQGQEIADMKRASAGGMKAIFKALFASASNFHFGLRKEKEDCPRLFEAVEEVARRVDTEPVDEVWISPGADFYVTQQGRGPFGIFGGRKRVLMLGLCVMHYLSVSELKSILAHEYAHFSHADTFWSRFLFQVTLSLRVAMREMAKTGGWVTRVNPFYWFFFLYSKSYSMLSAGFSRSREYLADRMACSLFGSDVFTRGLIKVCTDGALYERTMYKDIWEQLKKKKAYVNMYVAFRKKRDEKMSDDERRKLYKKMLSEEPSLYASHPTFGERLAAAKTLPTAKTNDQTSSLQLFDKPEALECEMTDWLTEIINRVLHN